MASQDEAKDAQVNYLKAELEQEFDEHLSEYNNLLDSLTDQEAEITRLLAELEQKDSHLKIQAAYIERQDEHVKNMLK